MIKAIVLCKRAPGTSPEEFREWFLGPHTDAAVEFGGRFMDRYTFSFVEGPGPGAEPWPNGEPPFDVISEFWVKDRETFHETYRHLRGGGEMGEVVLNTSIRIPLMAEEYVVLDRTRDG